MVYQHIYEANCFEMSPKLIISTGSAKFKASVNEIVVAFGKDLFQVSKNFSFETFEILAHFNSQHQTTLFI
jgi:hypothetical protein